jgi:hypothetical protein
MFDRLTSTSAAALAALAAAVLLAVAFGVGRMTAPSDAQGAPAFSAARGTSAPLSLPHLSQAVPLPALADTPAPAPARVATPKPATRVATPVVKPRIHRSKPASPGAPVDVVGSG